MKKILLIYIIFFINCLLINDLLADENDNVYMSLKFNETNFRAGPSLDFPILFTYKLKSVPIKVVGEYDKWFKIIDKDGDSGWVSEHLLSKTKTIIIIKNNQILYSNYNNEAYPIYKIEQYVTGKLIKCRFNRCKIKIKKIKGWIDKNSIWGMEEEI